MNDVNMLSACHVQAKQGASCSSLVMQAMPGAAAQDAAYWRAIQADAHHVYARELELLPGSLEGGEGCRLASFDAGCEGFHERAHVRVILVTADCFQVPRAASGILWLLSTR